jgi:hypothetical protein
VFEKDSTCHVTRESPGASPPTPHARVSHPQVFAEREAELKRRSLPLEITCFATSIWDETLYKAWSSIVVSLIPNVSVLQSHLENFRQIVDADEVRCQA